MLPNKQKTNQYINETELKSLMIRINNKTFLLNLSKTFLRLDKYISKFESTHSTNSTEYRNLLEMYIIKTIQSIIKSKSKQLLFMTDEDLVLIKKLLANYNSIFHDVSLDDLDYFEQREKAFKEILAFIEQFNLDMKKKNELLRLKKTNDISRINKYIRKHSKSKSQKLKRILKRYIIEISERIIIDKNSYERFGEMILLIIKNILKKPKFSGYTFRDEFYSDSTDKIFRYLKNFNHKLISKITGQEVNAFSYISQYVHNSIIFIINTKKTEKEEVEKYVNTYNENLTLIYNESSYTIQEKEILLDIDNIDETLYDDLLNRIKNMDIQNIDNIKTIYPNDYKISLEEYDKLKELNSLLNKKITIIRKRS